MDQNRTTLERAFDLARSGTVESLAGLRYRLKIEGYDLKQVQGRELSRQLSALIREHALIVP